MHIGFRGGRRGLFRERLRLSVGGDPLHEVERQGLVERKLHRALAELVLRELVRKDGDPLRAGVKADVGFIASEVDEVAVEVEGRDAVGDFLRGFGGDLEDRRAEGVQFFLHFRRELEDVGGDGGGHRGVPPCNAGFSIA